MSSMSTLELLYCQPVIARDIFWNWTRAGDVAVYPCPGGSKGDARWQCGVNPVKWLSDRPDLSGCNSFWVGDLEQRISGGTSVVNLGSELSQKTRVKSLYGGDLLHMTSIVQQLLSKMEDELDQASDSYQRQQVVEELMNDHPTADKLCKAKFKTPYIVKQRQWFRQLQETLEENYPPTTKPTERGRSKFRTRATPGSRSRSWSCATPHGHTSKSPGPRRRTTSPSRSQSKPKGGNGHQGNPSFTVSWSDMAKGTRPEPLGETAHNVSAIAELKKENAELRELISQLTQEVQSLKNCTNRASSQMRSAAQERLEEMPDNRMDEDSTPPPLKRKAQVSNDKTMAQTSNINRTLSEIQKAVKEQAEATNNLSIAISMIMNRLDKLEANVANLNPRTPPVLPVTNLPMSTEGNSHLSQGTTSAAISTNFMRRASFHPPPSSIANSK
ncbi:hypothetical protein HPB51_004289 [Rhipicephalus microplus]|uniref:G-protein coupled receptors family 2 profile 1 domain-containing protein n=1 Tax=Rhipicephalus microplus TaxID=6941 RepID=A0A9J6ELX4_RHIMP|nr:hypothetical protein HPB51_004289 [Rhipicephalus microplus]